VLAPLLATSVVPQALTWLVPLVKIALLAHIHRLLTIRHVPLVPLVNTRCQALPSVPGVQLVHIPRRAVLHLVVLVPLVLTVSPMLLAV